MRFCAAGTPTDWSNSSKLSPILVGNGPFPPTPPASGNWRFRGQSALLRPSDLDAIASGEHVGDHRGGRHVLAGLNGWRDIFSQVDRQPRIRAVSQLVRDPPSTRPSGGIPVCIGDDSVAQSVDRTRPAEIDAHVDALGNQATDVTERVLITGTFNRDAEADDLGLLAGLGTQRARETHADKISLSHPGEIGCSGYPVVGGRPDGEQESRGRNGNGRAPGGLAPQRGRGRRWLPVPGSRAGTAGWQSRRRSANGQRAVVQDTFGPSVGRGGRASCLVHQAAPHACVKRPELPK